MFAPEPSLVGGGASTLLIGLPARVNEICPNESTAVSVTFSLYLRIPHTVGGKKMEEIVSD